MRTSKPVLAVVLLFVIVLASIQAAADLRFWRKKKPQPQPPAVTQTSVSKQEVTTPKYLLRARAQLVTSAVHRDNCIVVYPDGRFHMEQADKKTKSSHPKVYESKLSQPQVAKLRQIVDQRALVDMGTYLKLFGGEGYRVEILEVTIPRPARTQAIALSRSDGKPPLRPELRPLSNWLDTQFQASGLKPATARVAGCSATP